MYSCALTRYLLAKSIGQGLGFKGIDINCMCSIPQKLHTILYLDGTTETIDMKEAIWRVATTEYVRVSSRLSRFGFEPV